MVPEQTVYRVQPSTGGDLETGTGITTGKNLSPITGPVTPAISPRWRGVKQGLFALVGTFLFIPVLMILGLTGTIPMPGLMGILVLMIFGSLLRVAYALFFESGVKEIHSPQSILDTEIDDTEKDRPPDLLL